MFNFSNYVKIVALYIIFTHHYSHVMSSLNCIHIYIFRSRIRG